MKSKKEDPEVAKVINGLSKKYGDNVVVKMGKENFVEVEAIPTGSFSLDYVLGCGGLPRGRVIEIFGKESSGKSTLALFIVAQAQAAGFRAVWIDAEYAFDTKYSESIGVNTDELFVSQPSSGEEGLDVMRKLVNTGKIDIIVVDSVAALVPQKEIEGEITDQTMALQARMMNKILRVLTAEIANTKTVVIFINQLRDTFNQYGPKDTTPGGRALKFFSSVRLRVDSNKAAARIKEGNEVIGNTITIRAEKNKVGPPFRETEIDLIFEKGIDLAGDLLEEGIRLGIITKNGNTYSYGEEKLGVGKLQCKERLQEDQGVAQKIRDNILEHGRGGKTDGKGPQGNNEVGETESGQ